MLAMAFGEFGSTFSGLTNLVNVEGLKGCYHRQWCTCKASFSTMAVLIPLGLFGLSNGDLGVYLTTQVSYLNSSFEKQYLVYISFVENTLRGSTNGILA